MLKGILLHTIHKDRAKILDNRNYTLNSIDR